jgi:hypothetical protein
MVTDNKPWRNRKERKEWARRLQSEDPGLEVVHAHAAGIDVGNGAHYVGVRPDRDRNQCADLSVSRRTFIVWQTGYGVVA